MSLWCNDTVLPLIQAIHLASRRYIGMIASMRSSRYVSHYLGHFGRYESHSVLMSFRLSYRPFWPVWETTGVRNGRYENQGISCFSYQLAGTRGTIALLVSLTGSYHLQELALWSRGRVDDSSSARPGFYSHLRRKCFTISKMNVVG